MHISNSVWLAFTAYALIANRSKESYLSRVAYRAADPNLVSIFAGSVAAA